MFNAIVDVLGSLINIFFAFSCAGAARSASASLKHLHRAHNAHQHLVFWRIRHERIWRVKQARSRHRSSVGKRAKTYQAAARAYRNGSARQRGYQARSRDINVRASINSISTRHARILPRRVDKHIFIINRGKRAASILRGRQRHVARARQRAHKTRGVIRYGGAQIASSRALLSARRARRL